MWNFCLTAEGKKQTEGDRENCIMNFHKILVPLKSCPTTRHAGALGDRGYSSYSLSTSALDEGEWSESRPGRALAPGKGPPVPIVQEDGWAAKPVSTQRLEENSFRLCRESNLDCLVVQPVARHYTDWATRHTRTVKMIKLRGEVCSMQKSDDKCMKMWVLTAARMKVRAFWDTAPCGLGVNRRFRGEDCFHYQGAEHYLSDAAGSKTLVRIRLHQFTVYPLIQCQFQVRELGRTKRI
jgi:hypothetical protein